MKLLLLTLTFYSYYISYRLLKKTLLKGGDGSGKKEDEVFVLETEGYINCVSALLKLIEVCTSMFSRLAFMNIIF